MENLLFEEKQYLGVNKYSVLSRIVLALFCFLAYYWSENPNPVEVSGIYIGSYPVEDIPNSGQLFFIMGIVILLISALLIFVLHIHTVVTKTSVIVDGLWTSRKVKIDLKSIVSAEQVVYNKYFLNRPVYNLHHKGIINFYTAGNEAVELTDNEGLKYRIGSQKAEALLAAIRKQMEQINGSVSN